MIARELSEDLRSLVLKAASDGVSVRQAAAFEAAILILSQLLKAETAEREVRPTAYQLKSARFPAYRDLNGFNFANSEVKHWSVSFIAASS